MWDAAQLQEICDKILECNQRWGTKEALEAEGIEVPFRDEAAEAAEKKEKAEKRKADKDLKLALQATEFKKRPTRSTNKGAGGDDDIEAVPEVEEFTASGRKKRKTSK